MQLGFPSFQKKCDNQGAIKYSQGRSGTASRLKHVDTRRCYMRDLVGRGAIKPIYFQSLANKSNGLTKLTAGEEFSEYLRLSNMVELV
ncbi:unnamed protein product [Amoebophrya sp. A25]|nr:unnamed protein product [Amoebophrya sp. A25]|eukprot:GSA25T00015418001.1